MDDFEIGRFLGRLDELLEDTPNKEDYLEDLESKLRYRYDIVELAKLYGKLEQKLINLKKSETIINNLEKLFKELQQAHIEDFKKKTIRELRLRNFPLKSLNSNNIYTVEDVSKKTYDELMNIKGVSDLYVEILINKIEKNGIYLKR